MITLKKIKFNLKSPIKTLPPSKLLFSFTNYYTFDLCSTIAQIPRIIEGGVKKKEVLPIHPHLSLLLPREMPRESREGSFEKGFKKRGCTLVPPFQSTGRRGTRTWHTSVAPWSRCKKRGARVISRELNLPSLTAASGRKSSGEFDPGGIPWLSWGIVRERGAR